MFYYYFYSLHFLGRAVCAALTLWPPTAGWTNLFPLKRCQILQAGSTKKQPSNTSGSWVFMSLASGGVAPARATEKPSEKFCPDSRKKGKRHSDPKCSKACRDKNIHKVHPYVTVGANFLSRQVTGGVKIGTFTDACPSSGSILGFPGGTFVAETRFGH